MRKTPDPQNPYNSTVRYFLRPNRKATIYADDWGQLRVCVDEKGLPWARWERAHPHIVCSVPLVLGEDNKLSVIFVEQSRPNSNGTHIIDFPGGLVGDNHENHVIALNPSRGDLIEEARNEFSGETGIYDAVIEDPMVYPHVFPTIGATNEQTHNVVLCIDPAKLPEELLEKGEMPGRGEVSEGEKITRVYLVPLSDFATWFEKKRADGKLFGTSVFAAVGQLLLMADPHPDYAISRTLFPQSVRFGQKLSIVA